MIGRWNIYHLPLCRQAKPEPKAKFVLIVCFDPTPYGFLINSTINQQYAGENPSYASCQIGIPGQPDTALPRASFVDCYDLYSFSPQDLNDCRGSIPPPVIAEIKRVVDASRILIPRRKSLILAD